jgi:L-asparagine transporter-like permease
MGQIPKWMRPWFVVMSLAVLAGVFIGWATSDEGWSMLWLPIVLAATIVALMYRLTRWSVKNGLVPREIKFPRDRDRDSR